MQPILLPILEANMTHGVVRAWLKREGDSVQVGDALYEVETDKVNAAVEAEASGVLRHIAVPVGTRVPVLGVLGFIGAPDEPLPPAETWGALVTSSPLLSPPEEPDTGHGTPIGTEEIPRVAASPAARRLARERGVALQHVRPTGTRGEIIQADVEAALAVQVGGSVSGEIDATFLDLLRRDGATFRALSSETKVQLYREHGARIGERVRIELGALIIAKQIHIGAASMIGADTLIECERLHLGRLVAFGKHTRARCRSIEIGDALWSKDDVVIGGGGSDEPGAQLRTGDACFFGEAAYLNTCHPLVLGDEVCIGSRAMLFTHSHWQSVLRGYPSQFAPIHIGDHVFIGNNAFVFPGVTIGAGATVMVNSFVALNVSPDTLVGGVPAQVVRHVVAPTRTEQIAVVRDRIMPELAAALVERGYQVTRRDAGDTMVFDLHDGSGVHFVPSWDTSSALAQRPRTVVLTFADPAAAAPSASVTLFDLQASRVLGTQGKLSDEVREFCRRRGIRFRPFAWRYGVGHCEGDRFVPRKGER